MKRHRSYLFTVRMWLEDLGNSQTEWRGKASYIPTGEFCYFREWSMLLAFFEKHALGVEEKTDQEPDGKEPIR